jgi:hypothetical protein
VLYFANASTERVRNAMRAGLLGQIVTPAEGKAPLAGVEWIADNSVFAGKYPGDDAYLSWLARLPHRDRCRFVVAPDVVADHEATLHRSTPLLAKIRSLAPVAFVAQNGATPAWVPWPTFDALFIGGDTAWKLGADARDLVKVARRNGKHVHMGRVNSAKRTLYAERIGCDSADGTYIAFGPDINLPKVLWWTRPALFSAMEVA